MFYVFFCRNLYFYLDALCQKDWETSKRFHGYLVGLYADYNPDKLLQFLRNSDNYPIQVSPQTPFFKKLTAILSPKHTDAK